MTATIKHKRQQPPLCDTDTESFTPPSEAPELFQFPRSPAFCSSSARTEGRVHGENPFLGSAIPAPSLQPDSQKLAPRSLFRPGFTTYSHSNSRDHSSLSVWTRRDHSAPPAGPEQPTQSRLQLLAKSHIGPGAGKQASQTRSEIWGQDLTPCPGSGSRGTVPQFPLVGLLIGPE